MIPDVDEEPGEERDMNMLRARALGFALIVTAAMLLEGCATVVRGTSQKIPVTSAPAGARVFVDGKEAGTTPFLLKLKRKKPAVIRIEREGYDPYEIHIEQKRPSFWDPVRLFGNTLLAMPGALWLGPKLADSFTKKEADDFGEAFGNAFLGLMAGYGVAALIFSTPLILTDALSGANSSLSPKSLEVELKPAGVPGRIGPTVIDAAELRDVTWLRIRLAERRGDR
jgi:uncharacterized protein YceK